jgi:hypothetical protein
MGTAIEHESHLSNCFSLAASVQAVRREIRLHLTLELLKQSLELVHVGRLSGPFDS